MKRRKGTKKELSRRDFIKTTAVGVGATALAGLGAKEAKAQDLALNWDKEADVVVVGYGGAGAVAAMAAADAGAQVLILEKMSDGGGTTRVSGGGFMTPTNIDDAIAYFDALRQGSNASHEMIEALVREAAKNFDYVTALGGQYVEYGGAQFPAFPGSASIKKYQVVGPSRPAENLWQLLDRNVKAKGIEVLFNTPAKELIQNPRTKEIVGVKVESEGWDKYIKAKKAVILTTGGFEFNEVMLRDFVISQPYLTTASPGNTGDGIAMAQKVGAALWHMTMPLGPYLGFAYPNLKGAYLPLSVPTRGYIVVDKYSQRVVNESYSGAHSMLWARGLLTYREDSQGLVEFPAIPSYVIFDEVSRSRGPVCGTGGYVGVYLYTWSRDNTAEIAKGWITKGATIRELANNTGLDPSALEATVYMYNAYCARGNDPDFGRSPATLVPITTPPYYAMKVWPGFLCTEGGPKRNPKAQVVDPWDNPIPRLYSAGELGSIAGFLYQGANDIGGECMAFGRIAGRNAAAEAPWS